MDRNRRTLELVAADKESLKADETLAADDRVPSYDNHSKGIYIVNIENITQMQGNKGVPLDTKDTKNICFKRRERYYELPDLPPPKGTLANQRLLKGRTSDNKCKKEVTESSGLLRQFRSFKGMEVAHSGSIHDAIFSPSDFRVASAGGDKLIKLWDPATGVFIRSLLGHEREVLSLFFSQDNLFLISSSADGVILIWSMTDFSRSRSLRGHSDCVYSITAFPDISVIISASHDKTIKTWHLNPRRPDPPRATRAIGMTETSILLTWTSPPAFSEPITAFHLQYRVGLRNQWMPEPPLSLAPSYRTKNIDGLVSNTGYFFRIAAENSMGKSEFSEPSKQIMTVEGKPMAIGRPVVWEVTAHSISLFWFTPNPLLFGSAGRTFYLHTVLNGEVASYRCINFSLVIDSLSVLFYSSTRKKVAGRWLLWRRAARLEGFSCSSLCFGRRKRTI